MSTDLIVNTTKTEAEYRIKKIEIQGMILDSIIVYIMLLREWVKWALDFRSSIYFSVHGIELQCNINANRAVK